MTPRATPRAISGCAAFSARVPRSLVVVDVDPRHGGQARLVPRRVRHEEGETHQAFSLRMQSAIAELDAIIRERMQAKKPTDAPASERAPAGCRP